MSDAITLTVDELGDVLRHYLYAHITKQDPWHKLNDDGKKHWRDAAEREIKKLKERRAAERSRR